MGSIRILGLVAGLYAGSAAAAGAGRQQQVDEALHFLGRVNTASSLEAAGSHGSIGLDVGAGLESLIAPADNAVLSAQLGTEKGTKAVGLPRLWVVKGLPLPVDVGASAGALAGGAGLTQLSAFLQWTIYEAFARPAVALRASYGRLYGATGTTLNSTGGEAVVSYGFLRYFTLYGRGGLVKHQGQLSVDTGTAQLGFLLNGDESKWTTSSAWTEVVKAAGLAVHLGTTRAALTGEADLGRAGATDYSVKLSYEL